MTKKRLYQNFSAVVLIWGLLGFPSWTIGAEGNPLITIDQLKLIIDHPEVVVIDVRTKKAWRNSPTKIKGAVRGAPKQFDSWSRDFPKYKALVLY